jgi:hypothetical protein
VARTFVLYHIDASRGSDVLKALLGETFGGILGSDRLPSRPARYPIGGTLSDRIGRADLERLVVILQPDAAGLEMRSAFRWKATRCSIRSRPWSMLLLTCCP